MEHYRSRGRRRGVLWSLDLCSRMVLPVCLWVRDFGIKVEILGLDFGLQLQARSGELVVPREVLAYWATGRLDLLSDWIFALNPCAVHGSSILGLSKWSIDLCILLQVGTLCWPRA
jgi:hypothetical protein